MKQFKSILLLKLPYYTHPEALSKDDDFRTKLPFRPAPSLALATLCGFIDKYKTFDYDLKAIDINIEAYTESKVPIDPAVYMDLLTDCIKNNEYDVLALSVAFVFNVRWVDVAVKLSRKFHPEAKIVIGGGYPTLFPALCPKNHDIDDVVIGEGESTFLHILNKYNNHHDPEFEKKFPFEAYASRNEKNEVIVSDQKKSFIDMNNLPIPAWHYLNVEKYFKRSGDKTLPIEGSRGCPYRCSYCCTYLSWGRVVRYKPVEHLINEIKEMKKRYSVEALHFLDDNLSFSKKWIKEFLTQIIALKLPLKFVSSNFSIKHLDEEIIDLLDKAGITQFGIAVESGSPEIQKRINKNLNFDKVREVVKIMKSRNLHVHLLWMVGFPNETMNQIKSTFDFARELKATSNQFQPVLPYPGTQLYKEAKNANLLRFQEDTLDKFEIRKCNYLKSDEWDYDKLREMIYDVNIELNFLNNFLLDTKQGMDYMLRYIENFLLRLPEHIIARMIVGYLYKQKNNMAKCEEYYNSVINLFEDSILYNTFIKYLSWEHYIIDDFKQYLKTTRGQNSEKAVNCAFLLSA
ncbi:MAG: radical SAM protein [Sedimentisphaerales bacterium]